MNILFIAAGVLASLAAPGEARAQGGEQAPRPRVLIVTDGTVSGGGGENADTVRQLCQGVVEEVLNELGFRLIDRTQLENVRDVDLAVNSGDAQRASMLRSRFGCDVIAFGRWTRNFMDHRAHFGREFDFYRSDFRLRAVRADNAVIVYSGGGESPRENTTRQFEETVRNTTRAMADRIVEGWSQQAFGAVEIELLVTGQDHRQIAQFVDVVRSWPAVQSVAERELIGNTGQYELEYRGEAAEFRRRCEDLQNPRCTVTRFAQTRIEITLGASGPPPDTTPPSIAIERSIELIVRVDDPQAQVTIGGQPAQRNADGTFSARVDPSRTPQVEVVATDSFGNRSVTVVDVSR